MENALNLFERMNQWIKESITIKLFSIGFLVLILMIPASWVESIIRDRENRAASVIDEIAEKWSDAQTVTGPVLIIPYIKRKESPGITQLIEPAFFLPEKLSVSGKIHPERLHRGIFEAAVYESDLNIFGTFKRPDFEGLQIDPQNVLWENAQLVIGISDLRGISKNPIVVWVHELATEPSSQTGLAEASEGVQNQGNDKGISAKLPWKKAEDFSPSMSIALKLKGSTMLYFTPVGKSTEVKLEGPWPNPSFDGKFIPSSREVTASGFKSDWTVLHYNRPFAQHWKGTTKGLYGSEFGVKLLIPVDQYQKSMRTAKYAALIILLTFIALFMVEIIRQIRIHPFQYILIGAALIIYYSLLLSFSEQIGFNAAYIIASLATVILISLYSRSFLETPRLVIIFTGLLSFFYTFIFVIIQMQDFSLMIGSIGLFVMVAFVMYFSKNINWYARSGT